MTTSSSQSELERRQSSFPAESLECPSCNEIYETPKVLPACQDVLCLNCVKQAIIESRDAGLVGKFNCPICQTENLLGPNAPNSFETPIHLLRKSKKCEEAHFDQLVAVGQCPHRRSATLLCHHCNSKFCSACLVKHNEKIRADLAIIGSGFEGRLLTTKRKFDFEELKNDVEKHVQDARERVESAANLLQRRLDECRKRSLVAITKVGEEQMAKVKRITDDAEKNCKNICDSIYASNTASLGKALPSDKLIDLYQAATQKDKEIYAFECLQSWSHADDKMAFEFDLPGERLASKFSQLEKVSLNKRFQEAAEYDEIYDDFRQLHWAARKGDIDNVAKKFLDRKQLPQWSRGSLYDHRDSKNFNRTPLHEASRSGHLEIVRFLVEEMGADVSAICEDNAQSAIHYAATFGHLEIVKFLLKILPSLLEVENAKKQTPLWLAVIANHPEIVKFLVVDKMANIEHITQSRTPLHHACCEGFLEVVKVLVENEANLKAQTEIPVGSIAKAQPIHLAAYCNHLDVVRLLIERDRNQVNYLTFQGYDPLRVAISNNLPEIAKYLISLENISLENLIRGRTVLHDAVLACDAKFVRWLIEEKGANLKAEVNAPGTGLDGVGVFHLALLSNYRDEVCEYLLFVDSSLLEKINKQTGKTALEEAQEVDLPENVKYMINNYNVAKIKQPHGMLQQL